MASQPKKWIAVLLGIVLSPFALLYVARWGWAVFYLLMGFAVAGVAISARQPEWAAATQIAYMLVCAVHAYRVAARWPEGRQRPAYSRWYGLLSSVAAFVCLVVAVRAFVVEPFAVPAGSMLPTLPVHSRVIVQKWGYGNYGTFGVQLSRAALSAPVARGDIIVFDLPGDRSIRFVKRVIGLPGDKIEYRSQLLSINGRAVAQRPAADYFDADRHAVVPAFTETLDAAEYSVLVDHEATRPVMADDFPFRDQCTYDIQGLTCVVPAGHYFTLGDNRDNSRDSRYWGFLPADHIVGKVVYVVR